MKINARVDSKISILIHALSKFPKLCTISSCEGREEGGTYVQFKYGDNYKEAADFFMYLAPYRANECTFYMEWDDRDSLYIWIKTSSVMIGEIANILNVTSPSFLNRPPICEDPKRDREVKQSLLDSNPRPRISW